MEDIFGRRIVERPGLTSEHQSGCPCAACRSFADALIDGCARRYHPSDAEKKMAEALASSALSYLFEIPKPRIPASLLHKLEQDIAARFVKNQAMPSAPGKKRP